MIVCFSDACWGEAAATSPVLLPNTEGVVAISFSTGCHHAWDDQKKAAFMCDSLPKHSGIWKRIVLTVAQRARNIFPREACVALSDAVFRKYSRIELFRKCFQCTEV